jgi:hypothetical protein
MPSSRMAGVGYLFLASCLLSGCGGGNSSSGGGTSSNPNPVPSIISLSPSVIATGAPDTTLTLTGTNFLSASKVNLNGTSLATTLVSSTQLTATIPSASLVQAANDQITVTNPAPGGGSSAAQPLAVTVVGSLTMMATPTNGGPANGSWQLSVAAVDSKGNSVQGLVVSINASEGTLSPSQGVTDSSGSLTASIAPPASYSGEAVALSATTGSQTTAVNIAFVPSSFNPTFKSHRRSRAVPNSSNGSGTVTVPFLFGTSGAPGSGNPFLTPSLCYTNVDLDSTIPAACQSTYNIQGLVQTILDDTNTVCKAGSAIVDAAGAASCVGIVATVISCVAAPTGIGAVICAGGLTYSDVLGGLCLGFITDFLAGEIAKTPTDQAIIDETSIGIQLGPPSIGDAVGLICDTVAATAIGNGTGSSGTQITLSPARSTVLLGNSVQFSVAVTGNSNTNVTWSVNGVTQGAGPFGTITTVGLYTAPSIVPIPSRVTVAATSVADQSASAPAVVTVVANLAGTITTVAGNGTTGYSGDGGAATGAQLSTPTGIAFDGGGNMFIADFSNNVIRRVDASTALIGTIAGTGVAGFSGDGGPGTAAQLNGPTHVVFDRTVNLYITDANNERIRKVDAVTDQIVTIAGTGIAGFSGDGGAATSAQLNFPDGVALDTDGNVFIGDALNNRVREVTIATGDITTVAGNGVGGYSGDGGPATNAELNFPSRPFVDTAGDIYIADYQNNRIRKVDASTGIITTIAGTGVAGFSGDGGPSTGAQLNGPLSVALDATGVLYIADTNNERIRAVNTSSNPATVLGVTIQPGQIETVVGTGALGYSGDGGPATASEINLPTGLIVDPKGNLFFADAHNNVVRRVAGQ